MLRILINFAVIFIISCQVTLVFSEDSKSSDNKTTEVSHIELNEFVQKVVLQPLTGKNSVDYNEKCEGYFIENGKGYAYKDECEGTIMNCSPLKSTWCDDKLKFYRDKNLVFVSDDGEIYGTKVEKETLSFEKSESLNNWCTNTETKKKNNKNCMCECISNTKTDEFTSISVQEEKSNIKDNMIITGVKFVKKDNTIFIQTNQNKLGANNKIETNDKSFKNSEIIKGKNSFKLSAEFREMNFDDIVLPENYVVTGVKFAFIMKPEEKRVRLEVQGTKVDWRTGKLNITESDWFNSDYMVKNKKKDYGPDVKRTFFDIKENKEISGTNKFIRFITTSGITEPGNTRPLLSGNTYIVTKPLIGLGLSYEKQENNGLVYFKTLIRNSSIRSVSGLLTYAIMSVVIVKMLITY